MLMWQADSQCDKKIIFCFDQPCQYFPHFPSITFHPLLNSHFDTILKCHIEPKSLRPNI